MDPTGITTRARCRRGWRSCGEAIPPVLALALAAATACAPTAGRGVECIAPANPGGGWDLTCRAAGRTMSELRLVPGAVRVTNMPGAGGAIAFAHAVAKRKGDPAVLVAASPATTLRLAQGQFGDFTEEDVRWVGAIAADYGIVAVSPGSPWSTLPDLMRAWAADPRAIVVGGGSAMGGQDHLKMLILARSAGIDPLRVRYVPFDGGGEAMTALLGGFVQVFSGDASEVRGQMEAGALRILAVLAPRPLAPPFEAIPTADEQGYAVQWIAWRGFYAPPGITDEAYGLWGLALSAITASESWGRAVSANGLEPLFLVGPPFETYVRDEVRALRELSRELGLIE